jgi:L-seryl-tRNA(Ser) seleniumtransferase
VEADVGYSGGGALPGEALDTTVVAIPSADPQAFSARLRNGDPPIVVRVARGCVIVDPRTLLPGDEKRVMEALKRTVNGH